MKRESPTGLRAVQYAAAFVGTVLVVVWLVAWGYSKIRSGQDIARFEAARSAALAVTPLERLSDALRKPVDTSLWSEDRIAGYQESLVLDLDLPLAVLRIPSVDIEVPVLPGTDDLTLNRGVGWIEGTAKPGSKGNFAVAGHRDGFFRGLKDIELGDLIEVETLDEDHIYIVDDLTVVDPADVWVLEPRGVPTVTLVTCYPFYFVGSAPQRFVVHASLRTVPASPPSG